MSAPHPVGPPDISRLEADTQALHAADCLRGGEPCLGDPQESTRPLAAWEHAGTATSTGRAS